MNYYKILTTSLFIFISTFSFAQNWNTPNIEFTYTSADSTGDSMVIWKLQYDSFENATITSSKSAYLGNSTNHFHMPISDAKMQPLDETCDAFSFSFENSSPAYKYYVFDMDNPEKNYTICNGQKELVIACMCKLGSGCCIPQAMPSGFGLNVTCNVEEDCLKCGKPIAYYIEAGTGKKSKIAWTGPTLVVKAKSMTYMDN